MNRTRLERELDSYGRVAVALSGGVDSSVVAAAAFRALGSSAVALTAESPSVARRDLDRAIRVAREIGIRHEIISTNEFENPNYLRNDGSRCYYCKTELYSQLTTALPRLGLEMICSGANVDDLGDYRPGLKAAAEFQVKHPLAALGFCKTDVRELAKLYNLSVWDEPASPCLSSRIVPGLPATPERTSRVEAAEAILHTLGFRECRVRYHEGDLARIEVPLESLSRLVVLSSQVELVRQFQLLGFRNITMDLAGLRSGNLNEFIPLTVRRKYSATESEATP